MTAGKIICPIKVPIVPPNIVARNAYMTYFAAILDFLYPNAFSVPI